MKFSHIEKQFSSKRKINSIHFSTGNVLPYYAPNSEPLLPSECVMPIYIFPNALRIRPGDIGNSFIRTPTAW